MKLNRILLVLALLAFVSATSGGGFLYYSMRDSTLKEAEARVASNVLDLKMRMSLYVAGNLKGVKSLAGLQSLRAFLVEGDRNTQIEANAVLKHFQTILEASVCYLIDGEGNTVASSNNGEPGSFVGKNYAFRPYFKRAMQGHPSVYMALGVTSERRGVYYGYPVYGGEMALPLGVTVIKAPIDALERDLSPACKGIWAIVAPHGIIFSTNQMKWLYQSLWKLPPASISEMTATRQFGRGPWKWSGVEVQNSNRAVDAAGNQFHFHRSPLDHLPDWSVIYLENIETMNPIFSGLAPRSGIYIILLLCLAVGSSVLFLYRSAQAEIIKRRDIEELKKARDKLKESEMQYRSVFENTGAATLIIEKDMTISVANAECEKLTGYRKEDVEGKMKWTRFIAPEDLEKMKGFHVERRGDGTSTPSEYEFKLVDRVGNRKDVFIRVDMIPGTRRSVASWIDITARKAAEEKLRKSEKKLNILFELAPDAYFLWDLKGHFLDGNRAAEDLIGYSRDELSGKNFLETNLLLPEHLLRAAGLLVKNFAGEATGPDEFVLNHKTGDQVIVELSTFPVEIEGETIVLVIARDVTERKRNQAAIEDHAKTLRTIMKTIQTGVLIIDTETRKIVDANPFASRMIGCPAEDLVGGDCGEYLCLEEQEMGQEESNSPVSIIDSILKRKDERSIQIRKSTARVNINEQEYIILSFLDITDMKNLIQKQDINIGLAKNVLGLINGSFPRYINLSHNLTLFADAVSVPCHAEGGDHFFLRNLLEEGGRKKGKTVLSLKDQSGHEVACVLRSIITDLAHNAMLSHNGHKKLEETVSELNDQLCRSRLFRDEDFFTSMNVEIDHESLTLRYVSAGHPPFLLIREEEVHCLPGAGDAGTNMPVGVREGIAYSAGEIQLQKGDKLIFYTDGLTEMPRKKRNTVISFEGLKNLVAQVISRHKGLDVSDMMRKVLEAVSTMSDEIVIPSSTNTSEDDITLLCLEVEHRNDFCEEKWKPHDRNHLSRFIVALFQRLELEWKERGYDAPEVRLRSVLEEAALNAWKHGNREDRRKTITLRWRWGNDFHLEVVDEGSGFDFKSVPDPRSGENLTEPSGRGSFIVRHFASAVRWEEGGRRLCLRFEKHPGIKGEGMRENFFHLWKPAVYGGNLNRLNDHQETRNAI